MAKLANCINRATGKWRDSEDVSHDILDHGMKRGVLGEVARRLRDGVHDNVHEAEVAVVTEMRDKALADSAKVEAALKAKPTVQAAAPRPVDRDTSTKEAFERMRKSPEEKFRLEQNIRSGFERIRAETKQLESELPPVEAEDPEAALADLDKKEDAAIEKLGIEEKAALDVATQSTQKRLIKTRFSGKRRVVEKDFTRQRQAVRARAREKTFQATREGKRMSADLRKVRAFAELNALVNALPPEVARAVGGTVTLAQLRSTDTAIEKFLADKIDRIDKELEKHFQGVYKERVEHLLKTFKPKKSDAGVLKSRIGADAQETVDRVTRYTKMTGEQVTKRLNEIQNTLAAGGLDDEAEAILVMEEHELNVFGAISEMGAAELEAAHRSINQTIQDGKSSWGLLEENRMADQRQKAEQAEAALGAGTPPGIDVKNAATVRNKFANFARSHTSFVAILESLFPNLPFVKKWQSTAIEQESKVIDDVTSSGDRLVNAIGAAIGSKSRVAIGSALYNMTKPTIQGPKGMMSQRQAIQYLFAWNQPQVRERMILHGWTQDHVNAMTTATRNPAAVALTAFMRQEYDALYAKTNAVYRRMYGMNLPRIEGAYAPMRYHGAGGPADITPTGGFVSSGVTPPSLKVRVAHSNELRQVDALEVFQEHVQQMTHWIHMAEFIRETRGVLGNTKAKMALEQHLGAPGLNDLNKQLDAITRNGVTRASDVSGVNQIVSNLATGVAYSALAFNTKNAAIQGDSALRWMHAIPIHRWWRPLMLHQWLPVVKKMRMSPAIQRRVLSGSSPLIQQAMGESKWTHPMLLMAAQYGFLQQNQLDAAFTSVSSAIIWADAKAQGLSDELAFQQVAEAIARFSQPIMAVTKSQMLVNASPLFKGVFMFMADPMLKTALAMEGIMQIRRGGNLELAARRILAVEAGALLSQIILNTWSHVMEMAMGGGDGDDEDGWLFDHWKRALLVAPLQGFVFAGSIIEGLVSAALTYGFPDEEKEKFYAKTFSAFKFTEDVVRAFSPQNLERLGLMDFTDEDFLKEWNLIMGVTATAAPVFGPGATATVGVAATLAKRWSNAPRFIIEKAEEW